MYSISKVKVEATPPPYSPPAAFPSPYPGPSGMGAAAPPMYSSGPSGQPSYYPNQVPGYPPYPGFINPPPGLSYGAPPAPPPLAVSSFVVTTTNNTVALPQRVYRTYLSWSIINLIFFFPIFGLVAVIYSIKAQDSLRRGNYNLAAVYSARAFSWNVAACVFGTCGHIAWIIYLIYSSSSPNLHWLSL